MADAGLDPLETILVYCAKAKPEPWYPSVHAKQNGIDRASLDPHLDQLRLGGLIRLTDWMQGLGQGYTLTPAGEEVLASPRLLDRLRAGTLAPVRENPRTDQPLQSFQPRSWDRGEAIRKAFMEPAPPLVTYAMFSLNIMVFAAGLMLAQYEKIPFSQVLNGESHQVLDQTGALAASDLFQRGQWWRLLTYAFVHVGGFHLLVNMASLFMLGPMLERLWGRWQYLTLYLLSALGGGCGALIDNPIAQTAGASGALWGLMTSYLTWLYFNREVMRPGGMSRSLSQLMVVLVLNVFITFQIPGISKGAHFGGGIVGLVAGVPLDVLRFGAKSRRWLGPVGLLAILLACGGVVFYSYQTTGRRIKEVPTFNQALLPHITQSTQRAGEVFFEHALPQLQRHPARRDRAKVEEALAALGDSRLRLDQTSQLLRDHGRFMSPRVENARQTGLVFVTAWSRLLDLAESCLRKADQCTDQEETAVEEQERKVMEAKKEWDKNFEP